MPVLDYEDILVLKQYHTVPNTTFTAVNQKNNYIAWILSSQISSSQENIFICCYGSNTATKPI